MGDANVVFKTSARGGRESSSLEESSPASALQEVDLRIQISPTTNHSIILQIPHERQVSVTHEFAETIRNGMYCNTTIIP